MSLEQGSLWKIVEAFNPLSLFVAGVYGAYAIAAVHDNDYGPSNIIALTVEEESDEDEDAA